MSMKPTHSAYIVTEPKEGSDRKASWHEIGAVWPHKNGEGFDIIIPAGLSVAGRIVHQAQDDRGNDLILKPRLSTDGAFILGYKSVMDD